MRAHLARWRATGRSAEPPIGRGSFSEDGSRLFRELGATGIFGASARAGADAAAAARHAEHPRRHDRYRPGDVRISRSTMISTEANAATVARNVPAAARNSAASIFPLSSPSADWPCSRGRSARGRNESIQNLPLRTLLTRGNGCRMPCGSWIWRDHDAPAAVEIAAVGRVESVASRRSHAHACCCAWR